MSANIFQGKLDRYKGVTIHSDLEPCTSSEFSQKLDNSLTEWRNNQFRGIWFRVHLTQADWVPHLTKRGFRYHHARDDFVMLYLWLPVAEDSNIPPFAHTLVGVGAVVVNAHSQILVVSEKYYEMPHWKLPGGYVEPGENIVDAAIREVSEETGVKAEFDSVLTLRQAHNGMFGCSDVYIVVSLKPTSLEIERCERELKDAKWMDVGEYLTHPNVHELNRLFVEKYLEYKGRGLKIDWKHGIHQVMQKPYTVYYITDDGANKGAKN